MTCWFQPRSVRHTQRLAELPVAQLDRARPSLAGQSSELDFLGATEYSESDHSEDLYPVPLDRLSA